MNQEEYGLECAMTEWRQACENTDRKIEEIMTREDQITEQQRDHEERRRRAEEAFSRCFIEWDYRRKDIKIPYLVETGSPQDWATIASEMGLTKLYLQLKDGK